MKIFVHVYNIIYIDNKKYFDLTGPDALRNYLETGMMNCYDKDSAPVSLDFELTTEYGLETIDLLEDQIKQYLVNITSLNIKSFAFSYKEC